VRALLFYSHGSREKERDAYFGKAGHHSPSLTGIAYMEIAASVLCGTFLRGDPYLVCFVDEFQKIKVS
jgi:hypothetical protein